MSEILSNPGLGPILVGAVALGAGGLALLAGLMIADRNVLRSSLRQVENVYEFVNLRDQELLIPAKDRILEPINNFLLVLGRRFTPDNYLHSVRAKMLRQGNLDPGAADRFVITRAATAVAAPIIFLILNAAQPIGGGLTGLMFAGLPAVVIFMGPDAMINRKVEAREKAVLRQMPDILDLLVICVEAGLGFNAALSRTISSVGQGELSDEFALALGEMKAGATRSEALANLGDRVKIPEIQSFVTALRQADRFGVSISSTLKEQAKTIRIARRQAAQEQAQKAPVKMLVPMVFFIFPPMFMVVIGPAFLSITSGF